MPQTSGLVQRITLLQEISSGQQVTSACFWIGPDSLDTEILFVSYAPGDAEHVLSFKKSMVAALTKAKLFRQSVTLTHGAESAAITAVVLGGFDISPVGRAIRGDFYSVTGANIPETAELVFDVGTTTVIVTPNMVRPHWVFVSELPTALPLGLGTVSLQAPDFVSDAVPVIVEAGPLQKVRTLYPGAPKRNAYAITIIANPILEIESGGEFTFDPIIADRLGFHDTVSYCLRNLLTVAEDILREDDLDSEIRFSTIFDEVLADSNDANALIRLSAPDLIVSRQSRFAEYMNRYDRRADVAFAICGSTTHTRATAKFTVDAPGESTPFDYDGISREHGHFADVPGTCTVSRYFSPAGLTALHEFGHMASDANNGRVADLYVDGQPSGAFLVNKKFRESAGDPVPEDFATSGFMVFESDPSRDGIGYEAAWRSYHPRLQSASFPNLMDNYWFAPGGQYQQCRFDGLTYQWFRQRLRSKIFR